MGTVKVRRGCVNCGVETFLADICTALENSRDF